MTTRPTESRAPHLPLPPGFVEEVRALRSNKALHSRTQTALIATLREVFPDWTCCSEVMQTPGGRNDAVLFEHGGQSTCFELFASANQVDRDLLLLIESPAARKIAILIDREIDPRVAEAYYRKRPRIPHPSIWLSDVLLADRKDLLRLRLLQHVLGHRGAELLTILRQLQQGGFTRTLRAWKAKGLEVYTGAHGQVPSFRGVMALLALGELHKLGLAGARCEDAVRLLNDSFDFLIRQYLYGVPMFLIWDGTEFFLLDDTDYDAWLGGTILQGESRHALVLLNHTYVRMRELYRGELPPPGDMLKMLRLTRGLRGALAAESRYDAARKGAKQRAPADRLSAGG